MGLALYFFRVSAHSLGMNLQGKIVKGKGEARGLGYPTANVEYALEEKLESGVWTCAVRIGEERRNGLAVIGMWEQENKLPSLEVHLLDFDRDIYDAAVEVELGQKLRDLRAFTDTASLVRQIEKDIELARQTF